MNDARPLYQFACVSQTDLSHQENPWLLFLTRGGTGEMSVIDVGALPGNILYSTMSTCSRLPSISARAPGYLFERGSRKKVHPHILLCLFLPFLSLISTFLHSSEPLLV